MPNKQEANARSQPDEGLRRLQEHRQVRDGAGGRGGWWDTGTAGGETASPERLRPAHSHATPQGFLWGRAGSGTAVAHEAPQQRPRGREQCRAEFSLAGVARSCLEAGAGLASTAGVAVLTQPPPSHTASFSPQVRRRQPQAAPQCSRTTASSLHGDRLPPLPCPASSQSTRSHCTQVGTLRETRLTASLTLGGADGKAGGAARGDRCDRPPSKLRASCCARQAARPCRGCSRAPVAGCAGTSPLPSRLWEQGSSRHWGRALPSELAGRAGRRGFPAGTQG